MYGQPADDGPGKRRVRAPLIHRHVWVKGPGYTGMEDNDLRGFLDGRFIAAWNQPQQIHVRVGRPCDVWSRYGEWELFRVLQRWGGLWLPPAAVVETARLELDVEQGVARELEILLYRVHKDWEPGNGGVDRNNNSEPAYGEVWWNEAGRGTSTWGLPGAGFASDTDPRADTPTTALALARYQPGDEMVVFQSRDLAAYIEERVTQGKPLLFLLKLSDYLEDMPGTCINLYSSNHGDSRNTARRPRLVLDWQSSRECARIERDVTLEHGRSLVFPRLERDAVDALAVSFGCGEGQEPPMMSVRGGSGEEASCWYPADFPLQRDWSWAEVRVDAYVNPLPVGQAFRAELRDTWVTTGPPEDQEVPWTFLSPSGSRHKVAAEYLGDWRWRVTFTPQELGRWQYRWRQNFIDEPYESAVGVFDVIPGDQDSTLWALDQLVGRLGTCDIPAGKPRTRAYSVAFNRLQRGLMRYQTPDSFPMRDGCTDGGTIGPRLDHARETLSGMHPEQSRLVINYPKGVIPEKVKKQC
jgi:hypothetical protein